MVCLLQFGAGWEGELKEVEDVSEEITLFGRPEFHTASTTFDDTPNDSFECYDFTVTEYEINGFVYLVAYNGVKPTIQLVEQAVLAHKPEPIR